MHAFLHDRRMLGRDRIAERGGSVSTSGYSDHEDDILAEATQCVRRFAPHGKKKMKKSDNGHITACKISDANPNEMVASWSGDWIYSFDLVRSPDARYASENASHMSAQKHSKEGRVKQSAERKRKRAAAGSAASREGATRAESRIRSSPPESGQDSAQQISLRVRYANGQSEDIAVDTPSQGTEDTDEQSKHYQVTDYTYRLRRFMFSEDRRGGEYRQDLTSHSGTFTQALRFAVLINKYIDEISRNWRYPLDPDALEVAVQKTYRENRESTRKFVQASGTIARLLGGTLEDPQQLQGFAKIESPRQHSKPLSQGDRFSYEFLKAIVLWLNSGPGALIEGFTSPPDKRQQNNTYPIPQENATIESIDDILIPYLLNLASDAKIPDVDASRFEVVEHRYVFHSEKAAVRAFADAVRTPFEDLSTHTFMSGEHYGTPFLRKDAISFWGYKVARGVLLNAGLEISSTFIHQAFGGVGRPGRKLLEREAALNRKLGLLDETDEGEDERMIDAVGLNQSNRVATRAAEVESQGTGSNDEEDSPSSSEDEEDLVAVDDVRAIMAEALAADNDDEEEEEEDFNEEDSENDLESEHDQASDMEANEEHSNIEDNDDDEESDSDTDNLDAANLMSAFNATASSRSSLRSSVQSHVPCSSHIRTYKGHCNVRTVKDVNYAGLNDEYVVSGSDDGNLFIWAKDTGKLVNILSGDAEVVNVVQAHPYEPMLAVSGIDNTIKIFSPDARAQRDARRGLTAATRGPRARQVNHSIGIGNNPRRRAAPAAAEPAWEHPHIAPHVLAAARARRNLHQQQRESEAQNSHSPQDANTNVGAEVPPTIAYEDYDSTSSEDDSSDGNGTGTGLASRRRMQDREDILSHNNEERQGGNRDAYITQSMLASIWQRMMVQRANREAGGGGGGQAGEADQAGGDVAGGAGGRVTVTDDDCRIM